MPGVSDLLDMYEKMWKQFVQPPKKSYTLNELVDSEALGSGNLLYVPFSVTNAKNIKLKAHAFVPALNDDYHTSKINFIVYAHSQSSNAMEGQFLIQVCSKLGLGLCLFDFAGSGNSNGNNVTLGVSESGDLNAVICHLKESYKMDKVGLWGRSMGAVSIIFFANKFKHDISFAVYDVPYRNLTESGIHYSKERLGIAPFISSLAMKLISSKVKQEIDMDIFSINVDELSINVAIPAVFIVSRWDEMVPFEDFMKIINSYGNMDVQIIESTRTHAEQRETNVVALAAQAMINKLLDSVYTLGEIVECFKKNPSTSNCHRDLYMSCLDMKLANSILNFNTNKRLNETLSGLNNSSVNTSSGNQQSVFRHKPSQTRANSVLSTMRSDHRSLLRERNKSIGNKDKSVDGKDQRKFYIFTPQMRKESIRDLLKDDFSSLGSETIRDDRTNRNKTTVGKWPVSPLNVDIRTIKLNHRI